MSALRQSFDLPNSYPRLEKVAGATTSRSGRSIAPRAGEQAMLAQELPKRPTVFLRRACGASNVPLVRTQNRGKKVVLESLDRTGLHRSERLPLRGGGAVSRQVKIRRLRARRKVGMNNCYRPAGGLPTYSAARLS